MRFIIGCILLIVSINTSTSYNDQLRKAKITVTCMEEQDCIIQFDFCDIINCGKNREEQWTWCEKYLCVVTASLCETWDVFTGIRRKNYGCDCQEWPWVIANTGPTDWGYNPNPDLKSRLTLVKGGQKGTGKQANPLILTLKGPKLTDSGYYTLGAYVTGADPVELLKLEVKPKPSTEAVTCLPTSPPSNISKALQIIKYLNITKTEETIVLETGINGGNRWLEWVLYSAERMNKSNCVVCSVARPHLTTVPFPLDLDTDPKGLQCMTQLFNQKQLGKSRSCTTLDYLFPPVPVTTPPHFVPSPGNYTCFTRRNASALSVGHLSQRCRNTTIVTGPDTVINGFNTSWFSTQKSARADIWWYCGGYKLYPRLPGGWDGTCALVQLVMPFYVLHGTPLLTEASSELTKRMKRSVPQGSFDSRVYIDAIGVPHGVPDEFKARNQIAAGFESLFTWWATINKNVGWINYIYYNQQRFVNFTRDAIEGLSEQLDKTSLTAWQNRMALDMLLAEKGKVCAMFGEACCTFIPNNTAPDGSVTRALEGLRSLSMELAENSGINDPFTQLMEQWFGRWSGLICSLLVSFAVVAALLVVCGCCCIPCIRGLIQRWIETTVMRTYMYRPVIDDDELHV